MWGAVQKQRLFFKSSNLLQRAYTVIKFRHANADGHVIIHDLADLRVAGGAHQAISVWEVQIKLLHQEVDRILGADLDAFLQRALLYRRNDGGDLGPVVRGNNHIVPR